MKLSLAEAAALTGIQRRTLRHRLAKGSIAGRKEGGRWVLDSHALPLSDQTVARMAARANRAREIVAKAVSPAVR